VNDSDVILFIFLCVFVYQVVNATNETTEECDKDNKEKVNNSEKEKDGASDEDSKSEADEEDKEKEETNKENDEKENGDAEVVSPRKRAPEDVIKDDMSPSKKTKTAESEEEKKEVVEPES